MPTFLFNSQAFEVGNHHFTPQAPHLNRQPVTPQPLRQNILHHLSMHIRQAEAATLKAISQLLMIDA